MKVYYSGNFGTHKKYERPGREWILKKDFWWKDTFRLKASPVPCSGEHFKTDEPFTETTVTLTHPLTGQKCRLFLKRFESDRLIAGNIGQRDIWEYPTWYRMLQYRTEPEWNDNTFHICDCTGSDQPRLKKIPEDGKASGEKGMPEREASLAKTRIVPILGKKSGGNDEQGIKTVFSSVHFERIASVEWRAVYYTKEKEDLDIICL